MSHERYSPLLSSVLAISAHKRSLIFPLPWYMWSLSYKQRCLLTQPARSTSSGTVNRRSAVNGIRSRKFGPKMAVPDRTTAFRLSAERGRRGAVLYSRTACALERSTVTHWEPSSSSSPKTYAPVLRVDEPGPRKRKKSATPSRGQVQRSLPVVYDLRQSTPRRPAQGLRARYNGVLFDESREFSSVYRTVADVY